MMPKRIQRKRARGWRMPKNTIYVGRPSRWGNPFNLTAASHCWTALAHGFKADRNGRIACSVAMYRQWIHDGKEVEIDCGFVADHDGKVERIVSSPSINAKLPPPFSDIQRELRGKNLACWCPLDRPCHADVLLELANE